MTEDECLSQIEALKQAGDASTLVGFRDHEVKKVRKAARRALHHLETACGIKVDVSSRAGSKPQPSRAAPLTPKQKELRQFFSKGDSGKLSDDELAGLRAAIRTESEEQPLKWALPREGFTAKSHSLGVGFWPTHWAIDGTRNGAPVRLLVGAPMHRVLGMYRFVKLGQTPPH